jgi:putative GTP pyrophosphokinase
MTNSEKDSDEKQIRDAYEHRYAVALQPAEAFLHAFLRDHLKDAKRIDRINVRAKSVERFVKKALRTENGKRKYDDPLNQIQDQLGARIVTFYIQDVDRIAQQVQKYLTPIEILNKVPERESEFGYVGKHFMLLIPSDVAVNVPEESELPKFFELQVKTLYQHAWAEANHDLMYKPLTALTLDHKRKVAYTAAQSWGADMIFDELSRTLVES